VIRPPSPPLWTLPFVHIFPHYPQQYQFPSPLNHMSVHITSNLSKMSCVIKSPLQIRPLIHATSVHNDMIVTTLKSFKSSCRHCQMHLSLSLYFCSILVL
jgi:hypothetical protein